VRAIDLNADCGEDPAALADGREEALLAAVSSANVSCGGHAGDPATMRATVVLAAARGVAVGAHPSYPDRERFGRAEVAMPLPALEASVAAQVRGLVAVAAEVGVPLRHVKPHGALYHAAAERPEVARALARAVASVDPALVLVGPAGTAALATWRDLGFDVRAEAFADRAYESDGRLRSRGRPGAVLEGPEDAARQAVRIARGEGALAEGGRTVPLVVDTIGLHADTPGAPAVARAVRAALEAAGIVVRAT
jgi:UPF0271 protein